MINTVVHKKQLMASLNKTIHFLHENVAWKRLFDFLIQENSYLKTRLSEVVDNATDKIFIANAEHFQNEFLLKDEYIMDIGNDIKMQERNLHMAIMENRSPDEKIYKKQDKLRNEIASLEKNFSALRSEFNKYLLSIVS
ncbi:MAG: hypothetical protein ABIN01_19125 [Ferruginibacter sp.]